MYAMTPTFSELNQALSATAEPVTALAACLFALRLAQEVDLRGLTSIQLSLERVRTSEYPAEADLLLGEIRRLLGEADLAAATIAQHRATASALVEQVCRMRADSPQPYFADAVSEITSSDALALATVAA
jgi:hypothetical protein